MPPRPRTTKAAPKTAPKTARAPKQGGARLPLGAHAGNTGGKKGRSGRKPVAFYVGCEQATEGVVLPRVLDYLARTDVDPSDSAWQWCATYVSRFSRSEAPKRTELTGAGGEPVKYEVELVFVDPEGDDAGNG